MGNYEVVAYLREGTPEKMWMVRDTRRNHFTNRVPLATYDSAKLAWAINVWNDMLAESAGTNEGAYTVETETGKRVHD
jgi:hypothetical protein